MPQELKAPGAPHTVILEGRSRLRLTGVTDIDRFDDENVAVFTQDGELLIGGSELHIGRIDIDAGELTLDGTISSLEYTGDRPAGGSLFARLFR
jgi:sporulation protein YabP